MDKAANIGSDNTLLAIVGATARGEPVIVNLGNETSPRYFQFAGQEVKLEPTVQE